MSVRGLERFLVLIAAGLACGGPPQAVLATPEPGVEADLVDELIDGHDIRDLAAWNGSVLVATAGGILIYEEGARSGRWTTSDGLLHQAVRALHVDGLGTVWLAFDAGGCQRRVQSGFEACPAGGDLRLTDFADRHGEVFGLTWDGAIAVVSEAARLTSRSAVPAERGPARAHRLVYCRGTLWIGSLGGGLVALRSDGGWMRHGEIRIVESLACAGDELRVAGPEGLFRIEGEALVALPLSGPRQQVRLIASIGVGWLAGMADGSAWWLEGETQELVDLPGAVVAAAETTDGLWLGGPGGLFRLPDGPGGTLEHRDLPGPGSTDVSAIATSGDRLALGLFRRGVALWQPTGWLVVDEAAGLPSEVNGLAFDAAGDLWVATSRGLARIDQAGAVSVLAEPVLPCAHVNVVRYLAESNQIAIGTSCGIGWIDSAVTVVAWEGTEQGLPHPITYTLTEWQGLLVAGTNDGLAVRDGAVADRPWTIYRSGATGLVDNWITAVAALPNGRLAVGTYSGGLYVGASPAALERVEGPRYVNPGALLVVGDDLLVGGLSEGGYRVSGEAARPISAGTCLPGSDVTGFAHRDDGVLVATRSGAALLPASCGLAD